MKYLTIRTNNNSFSFGLYEDKSIICSGFIKGIKSDEGFMEINYNNKKEKENLTLTDNDSSRQLLDKLISLGIITSYLDIRTIGFKVLGHSQDNHLMITDKLLDEIKEMDYSAYEVISSFNCYSNITKIAVFDGSFFNTVSEVNYLYPVYYSWYTNYNLRKNGYGGLRIRSIISKLGKDYKDKKIVFCDLDKDTLITAVDNLKCIDTSSIMSVRYSGSIDPSIIPYMMEREGKNASEVVNELKNNCGLVGLSSYYDVGTIMEQCQMLDDRAVAAKDRYILEIVKYIAQYYVLLGGLDSIVFTGSISLDYSFIRREICEKLSVLGIKLDLDLNSNNDNDFQIISSKDSKINIITSSCDEDSVILDDIMKYINR